MLCIYIYIRIESDTVDRTYAVVIEPCIGVHDVILVAMTADIYLKGLKLGDTLMADKVYLITLVLLVMSYLIHPSVCKYLFSETDHP